jgi:cellulose biosynthesis protein BcsQ
MNTFWVTFYSYKGGVGRTMALTNVAAMLAKEGRRVFVIDFDLEAPGLDSFEGLGCSKGHAGVVEYVKEYLETNKAPDIERFVQECHPRTNHLRGKLWLMPSGKKDAAYNRSRAGIDWAELYEKRDGERFVENWKAAIETIYRPDYVLIDSRTGLTDVGGICTLHFPQLVVLLYALNDQNIHGIAGVARAISGAKTTRPPQLLTVATPVPAMFKEKTGLLKDRLDLAEKELGVKPHCQIHYDPRVALKEEILVWEEKTRSLENRICWEYEKLRKSLADYAVAGLDFLLKESDCAIEEQDEEQAKRVAQDLTREYSDRAESYYAIAKASRAFGKLDLVEQHLRRAVEIDPYFEPAFDELIAFLRAKKRLADAIEVSQSCLAALDNDSHGQRKTRILDTLGELAMAAGQYDIAVDAHQQLIDRADKDASDAQRLAYLYNYTESKRRAGRGVDQLELQKIKQSYEQSTVTEGAGSVVLTLNHQQAMHVPYALTGDLAKARELLRSCNKRAASVSPLERVFCVSTYSNLPLKEWLVENRKMLEALESGTLWDGTPLSAQSEVSS